METKMPSYPKSLGRLINFSASSMNQMCNKVLAQDDLSLAQWVVLSALWREDGMLISELSHYTKTHLPAASRLIDRMEQAGLVQRQSAPNDNRAVRVFLTEKAQNKRDLINFHEEVNEKMMKGFSSEEKEILLSFMERILENLDEELKNIEVSAK